MQAVRREPGRKVGSQIGLAIFTVLFVLMIVAPFVWLLLAAFKEGKELYSMPVQILPSAFNLQNFNDAFTVQPPYPSFSCASGHSWDSLKRCSRCFP